MNHAYLNLLEQLVNIDTGTGDRDGLVKAVSMIKSRLENAGFVWEEIQASDGSRHYCAHQGQGKRILLMAHLDTVFAKGTAAKRPFELKEDIARGPGVSDCKSGVVTIIAALEALYPDVFSDYEICALFNSDEEIGSPGSRAVIERWAAGARAVLVIEPAEGDNLTIARKGIGRFDLKVLGKAAHSGSNHQDGANAILEIAHKIIAIHNLTDYERGITLNAGVISGGVRPNIVPDFAEAEIDLRIVHPEQAEKIMAELNRIATLSTVPGTAGHLDGGITRPPMPETPGNRELFEKFKKVSGASGVDLGTLESGGGSDANFTAAMGIPTLDGVGPVGGGHHSDQEYLNVPSLFQRIKLLTNFLNSKSI